MYLRPCLRFLKSLVAYALVSNTGQLDESGVTHWDWEKNIFHNLIRVAKFWIYSIPYPLPQYGSGISVQIHAFMGTSSNFLSALVTKYELY